MATLIHSNVKQSLAEARDWDFDFNPDLKSGVTLSSVFSKTHIPPSGNAGTLAEGSIIDNVAPIRLTLGSLVTGTHYLSCVGLFSNGEKSEIRVSFEVNF